MKSRGFIILFLFYVQGIRAQFLDKKYYLVDSLVDKNISEADKAALKNRLNLFHGARHDTSRIHMISRLVEEVVDEKVWMRYNHLLMKMALEKQQGATGREFFTYKVAEALALNNYGYYNSIFTNDDRLTHKYYEDALKIQESLQNYQAMVTAYSNIGNFYQSTGNLILALDNYNKALALEPKLNDKNLLVPGLNNMAQVYLNLNDTSNSLLTLRKCLIISKGTPDKLLRAHVLHNIGSILCQSGDTSGVANMREALELRKTMADYNSMMHSCISIANHYLKQKMFDLADRYTSEASEHIPHNSNSRNLALYNDLLGRREENLSARIAYHEKAVEILSKLNSGTELEESLQNLIKNYGDHRQYASAKLKAYEQLALVSAKIDKSNIQKQLMQQKYDEQLKMRQAMFKAEEKIREEQNNSERRRQELFTLGISLILIITVIYSFFLFKAFRQIKKNNKVISEQKLEVERQKHLVEEKHKDITDSINYAQRIQSALIISEENLNKNLREAFVLFKPRDIVSGDFYWYGEQSGKKIVVLADCTGHGVPGAFMSMIGITLLNQLVNEKGIVSPAQILNQLRKEVIRALSTDAEGKQDGMDMAIVAFDDKEIQFAGANSKVLLLHNGAITELLPNKQPIGFYEKSHDFTEQSMTIKTGMKLYLYSDGMTDQFGGKDIEKSTLFGKKLKIKAFKEWILSTSGLTLTAQKKAIEQKLEAWKEGFEQTDDISLIGISV